MCSRAKGVANCVMLPFAVTQNCRKVLFVPEVKVKEHVLVAAVLTGVSGCIRRRRITGKRSGRKYKCGENEQDLSHSILL
jgi:hypothetical protein